MATEKRLIDANASIKYFEKAKEIVKVIPGELGNILRGFYDEVIEEIKKQPTVDAVEVVRCKECYHGENCTCVCCEDGEMVFCRLRHKHMDADGFCSDGWREQR